MVLKNISKQKLQSLGGSTFHVERLLKHEFLETDKKQKYICGTNFSASLAHH